MNKVKNIKRKNSMKMPFYQTVAFKVSCILLVLGTVIGVTLYIVLKDDPSENNNNSTTGNTTITQTGNTTRNKCKKIPPKIRYKNNYESTTNGITISWKTEDEIKVEETGFDNKDELKEYIVKYLNVKNHIKNRLENNVNLTNFWKNYYLRGVNTELNNWNICGITDMSGLFENRTDFNEDISGWDVSEVTDMTNMFKGASSFNQDISGWNVDNVKNFDNIFEGATAMEDENKPDIFI